MPLIDEIRFQNLLALAQARFDAALAEAERKVLKDSASSSVLEPPAEDAPKPTVRAEFLRWLATDPEAAPHIDPQGIRVYAATIPDFLNLCECRALPILDFRRCDFLDGIDLISAETKGLYLFGSSLNRKLAADGLVVQKRIVLKNVEAAAEIRLLGARIAGDLSCTGAKLKAKGNALFADRAHIGGNVFFSQGFEAQGKIRLIGVDIHGNLKCSDASIGELSCLNMTLHGDLTWRAIQKTENTWVNLSGAKVKNLRDERASWPPKSRLLLDGLEYEELTLHANATEKDLKENTHPAELPLDADERIDWLMLQQEDRQLEAQPWMQLRALFERKGDRKSARHVFYRYQRLRAEKSFWGWRPFKKIYAWLEEEPLRIGFSIALTLFLGTLIFAYAGSKGAMMETARYLPSAHPGQVSSIYPRFQPFVYTLENAVPLIKLGMDERWTPNGSPAFRSPWFLYLFSTYGLLNFVRWALIVWGWVQATVFAAALAERFKK